MNLGRTVFAQLLDHLPLHEFRKCVNRYKGHYKVQSFSCLDQFLAMTFAQLTYRESLRDIETCLRSLQHKLYHIGIRGKISRSTLADANEKRDSRIYYDFAQILIRTARNLYADEPFGAELNETAYVMDATTIKLCLALFPWSHFRLKQGAIKLHTLMDLRGNIPSFIKVSSAKLQELNILDELILEAGSFYIFDRGYFDFSRLYNIQQASAFFVIRSKSNINYRRLYSHAIDKTLGLRSDQTVVPVIRKAASDYPERLRRIRFYDSENQRHFTFMTNHFSLPALTITQLYKCRWQVELFFKWTKQHLRIKAFYGTSQNAVETQIWIAIAVYVLVAIIKKRLKLQISLYTILQILSLTLFEKISMTQALTDYACKIDNTTFHNQLILFN